MFGRLSKYIHVMGVGFQNTFVYRWNFLLRVLFSFIPLMGTFYLWTAIFKNPSVQMGGYAFRQMISYFLALVLLDSLASPTEDDFQIASDIRDGLINQFLLKPINYLGYRFSLFCSARLIYTATTILPVLAVLWYMRSYLAFPMEPSTWFMAALATFFSATLQFLMAFCSAMMAFWLLDVSAPIFIIFSIEYLAGGHMFPLDLMSKRLYQLLMLTPFPYEYWFPLGVFLSRFSSRQLWLGFGMQILWCLLFFGISRLIWGRGIRKYTAVGG